MADAESAGTGEQKIGRSTARSMSLHGLMVALIAVAAVITHMKFGSKHCKNSWSTKDVSVLSHHLLSILDW